jgi:hypothetical protein
VSDECKHVWIYSDKTIMTMPPSTERICTMCGEKGIWKGRDREKTESYEQAVKRFANE